MGTVRYTTINGEVIAQTRDGVRSQFVPDPLGSTVALLDDTQTITDRFSYFPYGEVASRTGDTVTPFQFVGTRGYYTDAPSRSYVRARYLDSTSGRRITQDPIGLRGGTNLYQYGASSPLRWIDPSGLDIITIHAKDASGKPTGAVYFMDVPHQYLNITTDVNTIILNASPPTWQGGDDYFRAFGIAVNGNIGSYGVYDFHNKVGGTYDDYVNDIPYVMWFYSDSGKRYRKQIHGQDPIYDLRGKAGNFLFGALAYRLGWSLENAFRAGNQFAGKLNTHNAAYW